MKLTYPCTLAESEIVGRLLGPDLYDAYSVATSIEHVVLYRELNGEQIPVAGTVVTVRPVNPTELRTSEGRVTVDEWGQPWLAL